MYYMECFMYIIVGCYNVHIASPFSVYGENMFLLIQSIIIISLLWLFEDVSTKKEKLIVTFSILGSFVYLFSDVMVPEFLWILLMNTQFLMLTMARMPQIIHNFKHKSTGELSFITFFFGFCGNCARLFTVLKEITNIFYIITCTLTTVYNLILSAQIIMFWKNKHPESEHKDGEVPFADLEISEMDTKKRSEIEIGTADEDTDHKI